MIIQEKEATKNQTILKEKVRTEIMVKARISD